MYVCLFVCMLLLVGQGQVRAGEGEGGAGKGRANAGLIIKFDLDRNWVITYNV